MQRNMAFDQATADLICERLAGGESLRAVCKEPGMPHESTVRAWARDDVQGFYTQYTRAREIGYDCLAEEALEISDTPVIGVKTKTNEKGETETVTGDMIEHRRLRVDTRKWMLAKMLPKRYGDKITAEHTGADGGPLQSVVTVEFVKSDASKPA